MTDYILLDKFVPTVWFRSKKTFAQLDLTLEVLLFNDHIICGALH